MREGISIAVRAADRERLAAVVADRNSVQKHVWRARIILATAEGCGTAEIMRRAGVSKPCVWRWQRRFMEAGVAGLLRDKTRKPGKAPVAGPVVTQLIERTLGDQPGDGQAHGPGDQHGAEDLARPRPGAAPAADLRALARPAVRQQGPRHRRPLCRAAGPCRRALG